MLTLILAPLALIMLGTTGATLLPKGDSLRNLMSFTGAPVFALMVAIGLAFVLLVRPLGWTRTRTNEVMESALPAAATVILVTGAGGVFAKVLTVSGIGTALSQALAGTGLPLILLGFVISLALRAAQGSATVALITAAGLVQPAIAAAGYGGLELAAIVLALAAGSVTLGHVNDSGFWLVGRFLNLDVKTTLKTWTVMQTTIGLMGFFLSGLIFLLA